jgi:hypothetical protein
MRFKRNIERASMRLLESYSFCGAIVFTVFVSNVLWCCRNRVNGDVAWYLYAVSRLRDGAVLYTDIHDFNLPIVYLTYLPLAYLSKFLGIPIQALLYLGLWGLVGGVLFTVQRTSALNARDRRLVMVVSVYAALAMNRVHLGQRDTICALLFLPLVLTAHQHIQCQNLSRVHWCMIALTSWAIALKPHFLIPWSLVVIGLAFSVGLRRAVQLPEVWMPLSVSAISWAVTLIVFPDYLAMASLASRYYGALDGMPWMFLPLIFPSSLALTILFVKAYRSRTLIRISALITIGFVVECMVQRKGFPYHVAPAMSWGFVTLSLVLIDAVHRSWGRPAFWLWGAGAVLGSLGLAINALWGAVVPPPAFARTDVDRFVSEHARGRVVLSLSTEPWTAFPLILEANATQAGRDAALWMIAGMYQEQVASALNSSAPVVARYHTRDEMEEDERNSFDEVVTIMTERQPAVVLVEINRRKWGLRGLQFDFLDYFCSDRRFKEALQSYRFGPSDENRLVLFRQDR